MRVCSAGDTPLLCAESRLARAGTSRAGTAWGTCPSGEERQGIPCLVGERITVLGVDPRHAQRPPHEPVHQFAQLLLDRVGPLGRTLDIQREDAPVRAILRVTNLAVDGSSRPGHPLSSATISLWEKPGSDRLPPPQRLATYARLFCTNRSFGPDGLRLLREDELTSRSAKKRPSFTRNSWRCATGPSLRMVAASPPGEGSAGRSGVSLTGRRSASYVPTHPIRLRMPTSRT